MDKDKSQAAELNTVIQHALSGMNAPILYSIPGSISTALTAPTTAVAPPGLSPLLMLQQQAQQQRQPVAVAAPPINSHLWQSLLQASGTPPATATALLTAATTATTATAVPPSTITQKTTDNADTPAPTHTSPQVRSPNIVTTTPAIDQEGKAAPESKGLQQEAQEQPTQHQVAHMMTMNSAPTTSVGHTTGSAQPDHQATKDSSSGAVGVATTTIHHNMVNHHPTADASASAHQNPAIAFPTTSLVGMTSAQQVAALQNAMTMNVLAIQQQQQQVPGVIPHAGVMVPPPGVTAPPLVTGGGTAAAAAPVVNIANPFMIQQLLLRQLIIPTASVAQTNPAVFPNAINNVNHAQQQQQQQQNSSASLLPGSSTQQSVSMGRLRRRAEKSGELPLTVFMEFDEETLTEYQCLLRTQIEIFAATTEDVHASAQGRNIPIKLGQVGIRCRHCANLPIKLRPRGSIYYSKTIDGVYQVAQNMAKLHFGKTCRHIPPLIKANLALLRRSNRRAAGGKEYWAEGLRVLGMYEEDGITKFRAKNKKKQESKKEGAPTVVEGAEEKNVEASTGPPTAGKEEKPATAATTTT